MAMYWWIDRWRKSSAFMDMTLEEQGAYRNLLDEAHLRGGALPNDARILAKACGDATAWNRVQTTVMARFELRTDGWHNVTLDTVLGESVRRATNQANYRERIKGHNTHNNDSDNNRHNKPASPSPSPSPSLISGSVSVSKIPVSLEQAKRKIRTAPPAPSFASSPVENVKIITKLAHVVLQSLNGHAYSGADVIEGIKTLCAKRKIAYDAEVVRKALDSAEVQRKAAR
jgi:uncharacterized protein YdaU (DUF1376 family)